MECVSAWKRLHISVCTGQWEVGEPALLPTQSQSDSAGGCCRTPYIIHHPSQTWQPPYHSSITMMGPGQPPWPPFISKTCSRIEPCKNRLTDNLRAHKGSVCWGKRQRFCTCHIVPDDPPHLHGRMREITGVAVAVHAGIELPTHFAATAMQSCLSHQTCNMSMF